MIASPPLSASVSCRNYPLIPMDLKDNSPRAGKSNLHNIPKSSFPSWAISSRNRSNPRYNVIGSQTTTFFQVYSDPSRRLSKASRSCWISMVMQSKHMANTFTLWTSTCRDYVVRMNECNWQHHDDAFGIYQSTLNRPGKKTVKSGNGGYHEVPINQQLSIAEVTAESSEHGWILVRTFNQRKEKKKTRTHTEHTGQTWGENFWFPWYL